VRLKLQGELNDDNAELLLNLLSEHGETTDLELDFSRIGFASPFATLVAAAAICDVRDRRRAVGLTTRYLENGVTQGTPTPAANYLGHVGFFQFLGFPSGGRPGKRLEVQLMFP
jgi:hypothetical protein